MDKVQHFEIPTDNLERAKKFYKDVFGWRIMDDPKTQYTMVTTGPVDEKGMSKEPGYIGGGIVKRNPKVPGVCIYMTVESVSATLGKIKNAGGKVVMEPKDMGGMGTYAFVEDTEGNVVGLWETKMET